MAQYVIQKRKLQAQYFTEDLGAGIGLDMVLVKGSSFLMGAPKGEDFFDDEKPQHRVTVPDFFMGRYPVTQAQWRRVADLEQVSRELKPDPSRFKGDKRPVERVSWDDAVEFCERLSRQTGRIYRLPSEAEWEYACRAGTTTPFYFGKTITTELVNYNGNAFGDGPKGESRGETTDVDHFGIANAFGLCDMHGNVWEWCQDTWHGNYEGAPTDGSAWVTGDDSRHVLRGGSWAYFPGGCRSACRDYIEPGGIYDFIGFRVVCAPPGP